MSSRPARSPAPCWSAVPLQGASPSSAHRAAGATTGLPWVRRRRDHLPGPNRCRGCAGGPGAAPCRLRLPPPARQARPLRLLRESQARAALASALGFRAAPTTATSQAPGSTLRHHCAQPALADRPHGGLVRRRRLVLLVGGHGLFRPPRHHILRKIAAPVPSVTTTTCSRRLALRRGMRWSPPGEVCHAELLCRQPAA